MPRRRRNMTCLGGTKERPQQRNAANARERARMRVLSRAFCRLKTTLPWVPPDTKLSKLDTLRLATSYIAHLRAVLTDEATVARVMVSTSPSEHPPPHPLTLTWPFSFPRVPPGARQEPEDEQDEDDEEEEEDEEDEDWSRSSQDHESPVNLPSRSPEHRGSFLAHFTDALMDIS